MSTTYKTKDGSLTGFVPGVGEIVGGLLKNAPDNLESHNLVKVEEQALPQPQIQTLPQPQPQVLPAPVAPAASVPQGTAPVNPANPPQPEQNMNINTEAN